MLANQKVVKFENENMKIYNHIQNWFKELGRNGRDFTEKNTESTRETYEPEIRQFFRVVRGKETGSELEYLSVKDATITQEDFEGYIDYLCDLTDENGNNKYVSNTINKKIAALKSFIKYLKKKKVIDIDISYLQLIKNLKVKKNHYDALESNEVMDLANWSMKNENKGKIKKLAVLLAFKTGLRAKELLNVKWSDIKVKGDKVVITGIGKGNKPFTMNITKEFYEELLEIKSDSEKVFDLNEMDLSRMIKRFTKAKGIEDDGRRLVFHSIRKAFGTQIYSTFKDINQARVALRHENINTTQIYLGISDHQFNNTMIDIEKLDSELYKKVSVEELLSAITECHDSVKVAINLKLQEILKQNK